MFFDKDINTNWDDPKGWGKQTGPFLNTLHPITGNLVEYAIRVRGAHEYPIIQEFIRKADQRIKKILESSEGHDPHTFNIENYSAEDIGRISDYVKNVLRIFRMYYQTSDDHLMLDSLKCIDMSVGNLADMLERIETAVYNKLSPLCLTEELKHDIRNLIMLMNTLERDGHERGPGVANIQQLPQASDKSRPFQNTMNSTPPDELRDAECLIQINCNSKEEAQTLVKNSKKQVDILLLMSMRAEYSSIFVLLYYRHNLN